MEMNLKDLNTGDRVRYISDVSSTDGTISLNLNKAEVLMLQELTEHLDGGYEWMMNIAEDLRTKAMEAYQKPAMSSEEYRQWIDHERKMWQGTPVEELMVRATIRQIKFFYRLEGEVAND